MESTGSVVELFICLFVYLFQVAVWTLGHLVESTGSVVELFICLFVSGCCLDARTSCGKYWICSRTVYLFICFRLLFGR